VLRSLLAALLVLALIPAVALANTSNWAGRSVMDRTTFTEVVARALDTPEAEAALAERLALVLVDELIGVDERARLLLGPLAGVSPAAPAEDIAEGLEPRVRAALDDPRLLAARQRLVVSAHDAFIGLDEPDSTVRLEGDTLVLDAADILAGVVDALEPRFGQFGIEVPAGSSVEIEVATTPGLAATREALPTVDRLGTVLPLLAIAIGLLVVVVAHRRSRAAAIVGVAIAGAGAACLAVVALGGMAVQTTDSRLSPELVRSTYEALTEDFVMQSMLLIGLGAVVAAVGAVAALLAATRRSAR
jgi:hypothetical protein